MSLRYKVQFNNDRGNGYDHYGPFDDIDEARMWARDNIGNRYWTITTYYGEGRSVRLKKEWVREE
jgi:hypothetical protein